jgi:hypothetical protein
MKEESNADKYLIQHRIASHTWAWNEQENKKTVAEEFLEKAEPAMDAHRAIKDLSARKGVPEAISALGRTSVWKKQPEEWEESLWSKIDIANEQLVMAEEFLKATTYIPCAFYSLVSMEEQPGKQEDAEQYHSER